MARYIDADILRKNEIARCHCVPCVGSNDNDYKDLDEVLNDCPTADVVPKSEEGAECPTCHGTGRIGTTDWLTKNISKKQLAEEKAKAIAEHEQYIKTELASEIFTKIETLLALNILVGDVFTGKYFDADLENDIAELKKKYTENKGE